MDSQHDLQRHRDIFTNLEVNPPAGWDSLVGQLVRLTGAEMAIVAITSITLYEKSMSEPVLIGAIGAITLLGIVRTFRRT